MRWFVSVGTLALIGLAVGLGLGGLVRVQAYLNHQAELHFEAQKDPPATTLSFERRLLGLESDPAQSVAGEINRPFDARAPGDATAIPNVTGSTERSAVAAIRDNEASRTTEPTRPHQPVMPRAALGEGRKAVAVRVSNIESIAGFLVPDQPVDVVLTRGIEGSAAFNQVVAQNARMLATDRVSADRNDSPSDVRSVVLEVDGTDAQKLLLASQVGTLSLVLRNAGEPRLQNTRRIGVSDLVETENAQPEAKGRVVSVRVIRIGSKPSVYIVPKE